MDNPCLSHIQTSQIQPNAASDTKCCRNQRKFSLSDVHMTKQPNEFVKCKKMYYFLVALPLFAGSEAAPGVYSAAPSQAAPSAALTRDGSCCGRTSPSQQPLQVICTLSRSCEIVERRARFSIKIQDNFKLISDYPSDLPDFRLSEVVRWPAFKC